MYYTFLNYCVKCFNFVSFYNRSGQAICLVLSTTNVTGYVPSNQHYSTLILNLIVFKTTAWTTLIALEGTHVREVAHLLLVGYWQLCNILQWTSVASSILHKCLSCNCVQNTSFQIENL